MDDLETYGGLKVEIEVHCGKISDVTLRTLIELPNRELTADNCAKIRDTILFLRRTLPVTEIRADDAVHDKPIKEPRVDSSGKLLLVDPELSQAAVGQEKLRKALNNG